MNCETRYAIICEQEEKLKFEHFNYDDAWRLGCIIAQKARERRLPILCEIRLNGLEVFRFVNSGAKRQNAIWVDRKCKTVDLMQRSSLRAHYMPDVGEDDLLSELQHFDPTEYAVLGGGFPIMIKDTGMIGVIAVSGLPHEQDHELVIEALSEFIGVSTKHIIQESET